MNHTVKRTFSGLAVGAAVIAFFLYCPLRALLPVLLAVSVLVQYEFYRMTAKYEPVGWFGILMGLAWIAAVGIYGFGLNVIPVMTAAPFFFLMSFSLLSLWVLFRSRYRRPLASIASTLFGFFYVPFLLGFFLLVANFGGEGNWFDITDWSREGLYTLFALIAMCKLSDTGGFAFGLAFGRHKMCPTISPKKSWEGLLGSMVFSAGAAAACKALSDKFECIDFLENVPYVVVIVVGMVVALIATAGDLVESRLKREMEVKDSSTFMPAGMGGFLDMFDSILFVPAIAYSLLFALKFFIGDGF